MKRPAPRLIALFAATGLVAVLSTAWGAGATAREQAREAAASKAYAAFETRYKTGTVTVDAVYLWSARWLEAEKKTKGTLPAAQAHLVRVRALAVQVKSAVAAGLASSADDAGAAYYVAEAELWVADAGGTP